jgi:hypothetical protein
MGMVSLGNAMATLTSAILGGSGLSGDAQLCRCPGQVKAFADSVFDRFEKFLHRHALCSSH